MARLLDQRGAIKLMRGEGWRLGRGGKHAVKMVKLGWRPVTLLHNHGQPYGKGLTQAIIKESGLKTTEGGAWSSRSSYAKKQRGTGPRSQSSRAASRQLER